VGDVRSQSTSLLSYHSPIMVASKQRQNHLDEAEDAYHQALDSTILVNERRPWYLYNLAGLLIRQGRLQEALTYQLEAAQSNRYYLYWGSLGRALY
jgi:tetratricopeptide (TPR) repeat protein